MVNEELCQQIGRENNDRNHVYKDVIALAQTLLQTCDWADTRPRMPGGERAGEAVASSRARFEQLIGPHAATMDTLARRLCRSHAEASDLVQDTYERAWRNLASLKDDRSARAWLLQIMRNCYFDGVRRKHPEVATADVPEIPAQPDEAPARWERVTTADLRRAIEKLPEPARSVCILHDVDGLSNDQICTKLGIPYTTAATRLHRAHQRLKQLLEVDLGLGDDR